MSDITERLCRGAEGDCETRAAATELIEHLRLLADNQCHEIERLREWLEAERLASKLRWEEIERLRTALREIADHEPFIGGDAMIMRNRARAALEGKP